MGLDKRVDSGCFLIGSGPSLNEVDVTRLASVDTISFNRSYIAWNEWGFAPTFYACFDPMVFEDNVPEIKGLIEKYPDTHFFLPDGARSFGIRTSEQVSIVEIVPGRTFSTDISKLTDFGNVAATSVQILALFGYRRIAMVGVDGRYVPIDETSVISEKDGFVFAADDPNHFCPEYAQGKRSRAHPDFSKILGQWPQVAKECANAAIEVRNASPKTALDCFPLTDFDSTMAWVRGRLLQPLSR